MNFLWFEDFLVLAETGNFSRAAEERHVTQPAFSRRIRALESWLGVDLFDRSSQPARLTEVGEWFTKVAKEMLERVDRMPAEAQAVADVHSSTLRLAATHALSFTFLPRWLRALEMRTTLGPVQLMSDVLQRCEALLLQGSVQFVICHTHPLATGMLSNARYRSTRIGSDALVPVTALGAGGRRIHTLEPRRGESVALLEYSNDSGIGRLTRGVLSEGLSSLKTSVVFTAHLASVLRTMVLDGRGIAWLPRTLIDEDLSSCRLVVATEDVARWSVETGIDLFRSVEPAGKAAETFWDAAVLADVS